MWDLPHYFFAYFQKFYKTVLHNKDTLLYNNINKIQTVLKQKRSGFDMSRQERKNMIEFIQRTKGISEGVLLYMTDVEIEHIYNSAYYQFELIQE